ncbi:hypothetical protein C8F01DRAFT_738, partial [Mycena amicta]
MLASPTDLSARKAHPLSRVEDDIRFAKSLAEKQPQAFVEGFSPISAVPNEMLLEIFTQYLPVYPDCAPQKGPGSPIQLMLVCRRWHVIVTRTPDFWRALWVPNEGRTWSKGGSAVREEMEKVQTWLSRTRNCVLSLRVDARRAKINHEPILEALAACRDRWEYVEISAFVPHLHQLALRFLHR